jgi:hypothetical protein
VQRRELGSAQRRRKAEENDRATALGLEIVAGELKQRGTRWSIVTADLRTCDAPMVRAMHLADDFMRYGRFQADLAVLSDRGEIHTNRRQLRPLGERGDVQGDRLRAFRQRIEPVIGAVSGEVAPAGIVPAARVLSVSCLT